MIIASLRRVSIVGLVTKVGALPGKLLETICGRAAGAIFMTRSGAAMLW